MKKTMNTLTLLSFFAAFSLYTVMLFFKSEILISLFITSAACFYHFGMRIFTGHLFCKVMKYHADPYNLWFREKKWEKNLYKIIKVRKWKAKMPTYEPELFDIKKKSAEEITDAMCRSELVHETIAALSFLPLLFTGYTGGFYVFLITSFMAACIDLSFAVIQRYDRPRVLKILKKQIEK